ncbi:phosphate ABC transporter permease PstA [Lachnospiraceae bacterium 54-53]
MTNDIVIPVHKDSIVTNSIYNRKHRISDSVLTFLIYLCASISIVILIGIMGYVFVRGIPQISLEFITSVPSTIRGTFGIIGNIVNTLYIVVITLLIATPLGVGSAIYLNEYAKGGRAVRIIEFTTETLSGIPSIIFGLFGYVFFGITLGLGYSILTGALTLSIMVLPLITRTTQEALKTVPESYRSGALGIGATKWYMIRTILLPSAMPGIVTGIILAIGRIVGESAALLFTAGSGYLLPKDFLGKIFESGGTLTIQLYLSMQKAKYDQAFGIAVVLLVIVLAINGLAKYLSHKFNTEVKES